VAPIKLMLHLTLASVIFAALVWVAAGLKPAASRTLSPGGAATGAKILLGLVFIQIALGALVAGSKAGLTYNTWPLMDGVLIPPASALFVVQPFIENFVDNVTLVQFNHRMMAYALVAFAVWHAWSLRGTEAFRRARVVAGLALAQMALGIMTLILVVPLWAGLAHQVFAMAVLGMAVVHARLSVNGA
jgi:cytochrome c oxidase assembly protein subunit 15